MVSEAQKRAQKRYSEKMVQFVIKLRKDVDAEIIERLEAAGNRTEYIRRLVLKDAHGK